jgi:hypothetical protein
MALELTERTILWGPDGHPAPFRAVLEQAARNANGGGAIAIDYGELRAALAPTITATMREVIGEDVPDEMAERFVALMAQRLAGA